MPTSKTQNATGALQVYEKAIKLLHKREYERAADVLAELGREYPDELQLANRANAYLQLCRSKLERQEQDDRVVAYDRGVFEHNNGNYEAALKLFSKSLEENPEAGHVYLAIAATECRRGNLEAALQNLKKAVQLNSENRILAVTDPDLAPLREIEGFRGLVRRS